MCYPDICFPTWSFLFNEAPMHYTSFKSEVNNSIIDCPQVLLLVGLIVLHDTHFQVDFHTMLSFRDQFLHTPCLFSSASSSIYFLILKKRNTWFPSQTHYSGKTYLSSKFTLCEVQLIYILNFIIRLRNQGLNQGCLTEPTSLLGFQSCFPNFDIHKWKLHLAFT